MATVRIIFTLLFTAGLDFNQCEDNFDKAGELVQSCYDSYLEGNMCPDYKSLGECLLDVNTTITSANEIVEGAITWVKEEREKCPAYDICLEFKASHCMSSFDEVVGSKEVCSVINETSECLKELNETCQENSIYLYMDQVDVELQRCEAGLFDEGPCGAETFYSCNTLVLSDLKFSRGSSYFKCKENEVISAQKCLRSLKSRCTSKIHQDFLREQVKLLESACKVNPTTHT